MSYTISDFNIKELGSFYHQDKTSFKLFAPKFNEVVLVLDDKNYDMVKNGYCFEVTLKGNYELSKYHFIGDKEVYFKDPFSYYSDQDNSYVLDTNKFIKDKVTPNCINDIEIYEVNVRDFSSDTSYIGKYKGKFLSLSEDDLKIDDYFLVGIDYIKNIGVNYIQLMPIFAYDKDNYEYNWGYNPIAYNYVCKDYVYEQDNPYAYINELRSVINKLHSKNIRVSFDVVFNHMYNLDTDLYKILKEDAYRLKENGELANGSYCGNELKSENIFVREYLSQMVNRYIELFDVDGIRIDLMGLLDYKTINNIYTSAKKIKDDFICYGEGWNIGDVLPEDKRASILNADKLSQIAMFNDFYRDTIIDYVYGNNIDVENIKKALSANNILKDNQSLNYVECHDNYTFFDRLLVNKNEGDINNTKRCKLALALVLLTKGIPFIHMGQEFLRTKQGVENSYNSGDDINKIDWNLRVHNNNICYYLKDLISLRKENNVFMNKNIDVSFEDYYGILVYKIADLKIIINNTNYDYDYSDNHEYTVIFDENGKNNYKTNRLNISNLSLVVLKI